VYVVDADTGETLYRKDGNKPVRLHSLTKLVTAYVAIQRFGHALSESVSVQNRHLTTGSSAGLRKGDEWTLQNLLYGMLLVSGNDAALAIADHTGRALLADEGKRGDPMKRFVKEMNQAARALGAKTARFADPTGLSPSNMGTAEDVALIGTAVFREPTLQPFWRCARQSFSVGGREPRAITLDAAWRAPNGQTVVAAVLRSASNASRYDDMRAILAALPRDFPFLTGPAAVTASIAGETCPEPQQKPSPPGQ
jgi:D-alanyl-D-alanine carboxypeptidase